MDNFSIRFLQKALSLFVALLLLGSSMAWAQVHPNVVRYSAREAGTSNVSIILIEWEVANADLIRDFELKRSMTGNSSDFQSIKTDCQNTGRHFECRDTELYKGHSEETAARESVSYRLDVSHKDGTSHFYFHIYDVEYTTNAVRRTWGSIKAMFQ